MNNCEMWETMASAIKQIDIKPNSLHKQIDIAASLRRHLRRQRLALLQGLHDPVPKEKLISDISQFQ